MKTNLQNLLLWTVIIVGSLLVFDQLSSKPSPPEDTIAYSEFINKVKAHQVTRVAIMDNLVKVRTNDVQEFETINPDDPHMIDDLLAAGVQIRTVAPPKQSFLMQIFISWYPMLLLMVMVKTGVVTRSSN